MAVATTRTGGAGDGARAPAWVPFAEVRRYRIPEIDVNTAATIELADGRSAEAVQRLRGALAARPDDARAWLVLATTLERMDKVGEANETWADALRALPLDPDIAAQAQAFHAAHPDAARSDGEFLRHP